MNLGPVKRGTVTRLAGVVVVAVLALSLAACGGSSRMLSASAEFSDVGSLVTGAPVMMADVPVGKVTGITLSHDNQALVTMSIDPKAHVPRDVTARVRSTSLLGERIVDLVPASGLSASAPMLRNGDRIQNTSVRPDLEDLVSSGSGLLAPIAASQIATLVDEGYKGFGHSGGDLRTLLGNFNQIVGAYAKETGTIQSVVDSVNQLNLSLVPHMGAQAKSLVNSERALRVLREESGRLRAAIKALNRLSIGASGIMHAHFDQMSRFFAQMRVILGVLKDQQGAIEGLLRWAPFHNRNTQLVNYYDFNQVLQDFVICGLNDDPSDPARTCNPSTAPSSTTTPQPSP
ncbi:MAG: MCE family protein [Actinomycetota bacterium]|nr:MCE family protein [Actinomycetota bacterium]